MNELTPRTIHELLSVDNYVIPIYQRNYAWRNIQIEQLLQDVYDRFNRDPGSIYYIGTLIVYKRSTGLMEVIDGQQRLTTLSLINRIFAAIENSNAVASLNLRYESRKEVEAYLTEVYSSEYDKENIPVGFGCRHIAYALEIINNFLIRKKLEGNIGYIHYFYNNVKIIPIQIPEGTDINHYFEIMNTRGEQLEPHEILKARLMNEISNQNERRAFGEIWNVCSQMGIRVIEAFDIEKRESLFGKNLLQIPTNAVECLAKQYLQSEDMESNNKPTLSSILKEMDMLEQIDNSTDNSDSYVKKNDSRYNSIIDFPNFLLIVLRIYYKDERKVSFDDKNLLNEFGYSISSNELIDLKLFGSILLRCRIIFDRYIIKQESKDENRDWKITRSKLSKDNNFYQINTFGAESELYLESENVKTLSEELYMLQTMFHASYPSNNYKNWLFEILNWLFHQERIELGSFMYEMAAMAKQHYEYSKSKYGLSYPTVSRYVFNYLDYLLWKVYKKKGSCIHGLWEKIHEMNQFFTKFKFLSGNSIEHLFARKKEGKQIDGNDRGNTINSFGNLCLISNRSNSKYSNLHFEAKREYFRERHVAESLKQALMFSYSAWNTREIEEHENMMMELLDEDNQVNSI